MNDAKRREVNILMINPQQESEKVTADVPREEMLLVKLNGQELVTLLSTPGDTEELAVGFLFTEGIITSGDDISSLVVSEGEVRIEARVAQEALSTKPAMITSGCGRGVMFHGLVADTRIKTIARFPAWSISRLMKEFLAYSDTRGVHFAALVDLPDTVASFKEDIGRHNAIDKVLGDGLMKGLKFTDKLLLTTGRISSEMVIKAARAKIPVLVAHSCPTSLAVDLAELAGITVIGQAKAGSMNVYTHQARVMSGQKNLIKSIKKLKEEKQAVILAHNYQRGEVQDIADFVGDSLDLSRKAATTDARIIVFCGVHFMAETAKILSPDKTVLLPALEAGCPLANMVTVESLKELKAKHPNALVVSYVNTHADVKAESDYCCTSANGVRVVNSLPDNQEIIFTPDKYLGGYIAGQTGRRDIILMNGFCPTHENITADGICKLKEEHPQAKVVVHPECSPEVVAVSDAALGTGGMCRYVRESEAKEFIIGTEVGIIHRLKKENPGKQFYPASKRAVCPNMKLTTLEKVLWALENERYKIEVPEKTAQQARKAIDRMLSIQ